ncbi:hypothetical protein CERZMDRAFT_118999 [Cercospora zeae-maydis SCOH1-5]|uniref:Uncharacterized protein n=1 Tax=Cercospora zeae-maydis SCOH1-5 TaxID=717836 RepID=A0A6A6F5X8_9PEZI|nr:hypothetical protein CERZMDRAFT_118999 [Cercospora zeae-maydis SCOH1-5]
MGESSPKGRAVAQNMSKSELLATIGFKYLHTAASLGLFAALLHSAYHSIRRTPVRPSYLRTAGLATTAIFAYLTVKKLVLRYLHEIPNPSNELQRQEEQATATDQDQHVSRKAARTLQALRAHNIATAAFAVCGAGFVALQSGIRRANIFRIIGGACVGSEIQWVRHAWAVGQTMYQRG